MIYLHVAKIGHLGVASPLDRLPGSNHSAAECPDPPPVEYEPSIVDAKQPDESVVSSGIGSDASDVPPQRPRRLHTGLRVVRHVAALVLAFVVEGWTRG